MGLYSLKVAYYSSLKVSQRHKHITQRDLNHSFEGPEFSLDEKYGEQLGFVFVSMLFSGGMPLMYVTAFVSFFLTYHLEKYFLLQASTLLALHAI